MDAMVELLEHCRWCNPNLNMNSRGEVEYVALRKCFCYVSPGVGPQQIHLAKYLAKAANQLTKQKLEVCRTVGLATHPKG